MRTRKLLDFISIVILLGGVSLLGGNLILRRTPARLDIPPEVLAGSHWIGPTDAPVVLLVYTTYHCGNAAVYHENLLAVTARFPEQVALAIKQFGAPEPLDYVVLAGECAAEQGAFERYSSVAFRGVRAPEGEAPWMAIASTAEIPDLDALAECVDSGRHADKLARDYEEAVGFGVQGTPTTFLNGRRLLGAAPLEVLESLIRDELARAS